MKVVIATDKFKGCLSALEVCKSIASGIHDFNPSIKTLLHPLADGGDGSIDVLKKYFNLKPRKVIVKDSLLRNISTYYLVNDLVNQKTAYIEMSKVCGLGLLKPEEKNCLHTSTYGLGQIIDNAIKHSYKKITLFIGGSSTCDAGIGMAAALGYQFFSKKNRLLPIQELTGQALSQIARIEIPPSHFKKLKKIKVEVITDVINPLYGKMGAAYVFAPQKGASPNEVKLLDQGLRNIHNLFKKQFSQNVAKIKGSGAAGGLGAGCLVFLQAKLHPGIDFFLKQTNFAKACSNAQVIISGEGQFDSQSQQGKVISGVAQFVQSKTSKNPPKLFILCGQIKTNPKQLQKMGIERGYSLLEHCQDLETCMTKPKPIIKQLAFNLIQDLLKPNNK